MIATPWSSHIAVASEALEAGLHVLCEKPLTLELCDIDRLIELRERCGRVVQVGYMKRFEPAVAEWLRACGPLEQLRRVSIEVQDPNSGSLLAHHHLEAGPSHHGPDPAADAVRRRLAIADDASWRAYVRSFGSSLVHDINLLHLLLEYLGHPLPLAPVAASHGLGGAAVTADWALENGARVSASYLSLPTLPLYREEIRCYFDDRVVELRLRAPYFMFEPAEVIVTSADSGGLVTTTLRPPAAEQFVLQLDGFARAIDGGEVRGTLEDARRDLVTVRQAFELADR